MNSYLINSKLRFPYFAFNEKYDIIKDEALSKCLDLPQLSFLKIITIFLGIISLEFLENPRIINE